jgi:uncharacterized coiled-coil DUF342 family protein
MMPDPSRVKGSERPDAIREDTVHEPGKGPIAPVMADPTVPAETPKPSLFRRLWPPIMLALLLTVAAGLWWQQSNVLDWLKLRGYTPPHNIQQLAQQTTLTPYAERLLYVNHPAIEERSEFNKNCPNASDEVAVLGCYRGDRQGIHIYDVTDKRLDGIQQVTAAHEMLHQAYDRLSRSERADIDAQLQAYAKTVTDKTLLDKLDAYKKSEPNDLTNEMHSIFGTEVAKLPAPLENYYKRYFNNRPQVLAYYAQYRQAFTQRQERIAEIDAQLDHLKPELDTSKADLQSRENDLQAQRNQLDKWLADNEVDKYNAAVPGFNAKVSAYKSAIAATNDLINTYNKLVDERNTLTVQEQELLHAQDSNAPAADMQ